MIHLDWEWIAIGYFSYLLIVSIVDGRFARARVGALVGTAFSILILVAQSSESAAFPPNTAVLAFVIPLAVLLGGYWLSGFFFVRPMQTIERQLMAGDNRLLRRSGVLMAYRRSPQVVHEFFEIAYVLVYVVIPAGVATLAIGGHADAIPRFWSVVLLAEFVSYGTMPWVQTRPPRALEMEEGPKPVVRRLNAAILDNGSIQANTVPSGHAAGAVATALGVAGVMPLAGLVFLATASCIVVATVLGRYHYLIDSLLGIAVAVAAWSLLY